MKIVSLFPDRYLVPALPAVRYEVAQRLIRPQEIRDRIRIVYVQHLPRDHSTAREVAGWLTSQLHAGVLRYIYDRPGLDVWQAPSLTFARGGGDCEDLSFVALSALELLGVPSWLVVGRLPAGGHAWVEGRDEQGGFLLESTSGQLSRGPRPRGYSVDEIIGRGWYRLVA